MSDQNTLNIEVPDRKFLSLSYNEDGTVNLAIRFTKQGYNILGNCTITKDRLQMVSDFFNQQPKGTNQ